jgi:hypothetical protein
MAIITMGPVLSFRGVRETKTTPVWQVTVMIALDAAEAPPELTLNGARQPAPVTLLTHAGTQVLRYDASVALGEEEARVDYGFGTGTTWSFTVPALQVVPRMAYVSCNGFSNPDGMRKLVNPANEVWSDLLSNHDKRFRPAGYALDREQRWHEPISHDQDLQRFHVLMMGGDQIYFDSIWEEIEVLKDWVSLSRREQLAFQPDARLRQEIENYFFGLYLKRWSIGAGKDWGTTPFSCKTAAAAMATMPTVMMWDDHDIFDGWGSYSPEMQESPLFRCLFQQARRAFWVYQLQHRLEDLPDLVVPDPKPVGCALDPTFSPIDWETRLAADHLHLPLLPGQPGFSYALVMGTVALMVMDLRTERSRTQILGEATWAAFTRAIQDTSALKARNVEHLLIMSSVPVAHPKISLAESLLSIFGSDHVTDSNADDINDHWSHDRHDGERKRLIRNLIKAGKDQQLRITIVSGDVHVAAWGTIYRKDATPATNGLRINQLTSSAVVHPSLSNVFERAFLGLLNHAATQPQPIDTEHAIEMMLFPESSERVYAARNWLAIEPDRHVDPEFQGRRLWATWRCEHQTRPTNHLMAIHPNRATGDLKPQ